MTTTVVVAPQPKRGGKKEKNGNVPINLKLSLLREMPPNQAASILVQVKHIEKHTFPTSEAMVFDSELLTKPNTSVLVLLRYEIDTINVIAYATFVRRQRQLLLHKICVHSDHRNQGNGSRLLSDIITRARRTSCSTITLWVDEERTLARKLYNKYSFTEVDRVENYYSAGRHGLQLSLKL